MQPELPRFGEKDRCPHCNGLTVLAEHRELWWVCGVCGGPRIPLGAGEKLTEDARRALGKSNEERVRSAMFRYGSFVSYFIALSAIVLGGALAPISIAAAIAPLALGIALAVAGFGLGARSRRAKGHSTEAWEKAWEREMEHLLAASKGALTAAKLARKMKVPEEEIEKIAARLSASDRVRVDVGDDAQLRISVTENAELDEEHQEHLEQQK